jgi:two-component sensor histidine kinase/DNA-binding response OmpR family regulator
MPTVMIAEDDLMMADMLEEVLVNGGYEVCGIARTVDQAVELGERLKPDLAVLDIRLADGGIGTDIAARLHRPGGLGVLYATGHLGGTGLTKANGDAVIVKPYQPNDVVRSLKIVQQIVDTGEASRPFPKGFAVLDDDGSRLGLVDMTLNNQIAQLRRQQSELAKFGSYACEEHDLGSVFTEAARVCTNCLETSISVIYRCRPEENDLVIEAGTGMHAGVVGRVTARSDERSPQGRALISGEPVICGNLSKDGTFVLSPYYAEHGIMSSIDVIIGDKSRPYGVLEVSSTASHVFRPEDADFLAVFANILALSVIIHKRNASLGNASDQIEDLINDRERVSVANAGVLKEKDRVHDENALLIRELQHRVRNNLQLVYGMLMKQVTDTADIAGSDGIRAIARRVMTLVQVYDHLLGTGLARTTDFGKYLSSLCSAFGTLQRADHAKIEFTCRTVPLMLDLDAVTALGLVVSELIANSYAHAFPGGTGSISVVVSSDEPNDSATITFNDNGVGFIESDKGERHGLELVKRLMEQVNGTARVRSDHGTEWTLKFPVPATATAHDTTIMEP